MDFGKLIKVGAPTALGYAAAGPLGGMLGASLGGALLGSDAADAAAKSSADASRYSADVQRQMFDKNIELQTPWREAGTASLADLLALTKDPTLATQSPGAQYRLDQALGALENRAAASGSLNSGNTLRALMSQAQQSGQGEYDAQWNKLASLAGIGQTATNQMTGMGSQFAGNIGNIAMSNAANQGNAALASANMTNSALQGGMNTLGMWYARQPGGTGGGSTMTPDSVWMSTPTSTGTGYVAPTW